MIYGILRDIREINPQTIQLAIRTGCHITGQCIFMNSWTLSPSLLFMISSHYKTSEFLIILLSLLSFKHHFIQSEVFPLNETYTTCISKLYNAQKNREKSPCMNMHADLHNWSDQQLRTYVSIQVEINSPIRFKHAWTNCPWNCVLTRTAIM